MGGGPPDQGAPHDGTDPELATLGWVDWFNHTRLHSAPVYRTPAQAEAEHYRHQHNTAERPLAAELTVH